MMVKLVTIDMDGTLLNSRNEISNENRNAIQQAQASGVQVVIATGRNYRMQGSAYKKSARSL
jgi:HAD superfamily hydrolase (TIGR01484 family)